MGNVVLGQTNINDIEKDLIPLWFDLAQSDLAKVNVSLLPFEISPVHSTHPAPVWPGQLRTRLYVIEPSMPDGKWDLLLEWA